MNKLFGFIIVLLLLAIGGMIYSDYSSQFTNLLCENINFCNDTIINQSKSIVAFSGNVEHKEPIIKINGYDFIDQNTLHKVISYGNEKEINIYGKIYGSQMSYSGVNVATIKGDTIVYKNISLTLPQDMIGWSYRFFTNSGVIKNELLHIMDKIGLIEGTFITNKNIAFIINNNDSNIKIKDFCDDQNLPGPGNRVADSISKDVVNSGGILLYKIYRLYNEPQQESNGEICTIKNNILYKIFIYNYSEQETKKILDSFQFIY